MELGRAVVSVAYLICAALSSGQNLLQNPGFEAGLSHWETSGAGWRAGEGPDAHSGGIGAVCDVLRGDPVSERWRIVHQEIDVRPGEVMSASARVRTVSLRRSRSFFEVQFLDAAGKSILQFDSPQVSVASPYHAVTFPILVAPEGAAFISVRGVVDVTSSIRSQDPEFHTWDDFDLHRISITGDDRRYLKTLAADTWRSIESLTNDANGLPFDSSTRGDYTSTTNIGFAMASVVAARDLGFLSEDQAREKLSTTIGTLERLPTWHGFQATWTNVRTGNARLDEPEHVVSMLDAGNLAASLITVGEAVPALRKRCHALVDAMDIPYFYDLATKRLHGGWGIRAKKFVPSWWVTDLGNDSRMISFLGIAKGIPIESWTGLNRAKANSHGVAYFLPGWQGGGLFMQYIAGMFLDERSWEAGISAKNFAFDQVAHTDDIGYPVWGWSACDSPLDGYTNTYGMSPHDNVVAPYASVLAIEDWPEAVVQNLKHLEALGARDLASRFGFFDSYDLRAKAPSPSHLVLDQSMILISLCNYLDRDAIKRYFGSSAMVKKGRSRLAGRRVDDSR